MNEDKFDHTQIVHKIGNSFATTMDGLFITNPGSGEVAVVRENPLYDKAAVAARIAGGLQSLDAEPEEPEAAQSMPGIQSTWYTQGSIPLVVIGHGRITMLADMRGPFHFARWHFYDNQWYFGPDADGYGPEGTAFGNYHDSLLALNLDNYFRTGSLSSAPGAWVGSLDAQSFYPYGTFFERGIRQEDLQVARTITNRQAGRGNWRHVYGRLDHVVDWNAAYVVGIADQQVAFRQTVAWTDSNSTYYWDENTISGELISVHRKTGAEIARFPIGFHVRYHSESEYWTVSADEQGQAFFVFTGGPYCTLIYNIPMLASGDQIVVMRYEQHDWAHSVSKPGNITQGIIATRVNWARVRFFKTDVRFARWDEFVPVGLEGQLIWEAFKVWETADTEAERTTFPSQASSVGQFIFTTPSTKYGDGLQMLCAPWVYKGRLYIHTLEAPPIHVERLVKKNIVETFTFPTVITAYSLLGKSPRRVTLTDRRSQVSSYSHDWRFYVVNSYYGSAIDDPRVFAGDKNVMIYKTGTPPKANY